jgi:hypothetical protein
MAPTLASPAAFYTHFQEHELKLLVAMVRLSRVTLLIAEQQSDKSGFLQSTLMPLLGRDAPAADNEIAVLFDAWDEAPVPALRTRIRQLAGDAVAPIDDTASLAATLSAYQEALGVTFLIVFDRFEDYLRQSSDRARVAEFEESLVEVVLDPALRANFLLALDDTAEPLLARLQTRIPGFGDSRVRLPRASYSARTAEQEPPQELYRMPPATPPAPPEPVVRPQVSRPAPVQPAASVTGADTRAEPARKLESSIVAAAELLALQAEQQAAAARWPRRAATPEPAETSPAIAEPRVQPEMPEVVPSPETKQATVPPTPAEQRVVQAKVREATIPQPPSRMDVAATPRRRLPGLAWAPLILVPLVVVIFWQYKPTEPAEEVTSAPVEESKPAAPRDAVSAEQKQSVTAPAAPRASEPVVTRSPAPESALPPQPPPTAASPAPPQPSPPQALSAPPEKVAPRAPAVTAPSAEVPKPNAARATPEQSKVASPSIPQPLRKPEATKPVAETRPSPPSTAAAAVQRSAKPETVATAPSAVRAPRASGETPSGPVLRILVQSDSQRAAAERLIAPLKERGIRVTGIVVAPRGGEAAHVRYYDLADRNEAMKVAAALGDAGISARQLKHMPATEMGTLARRYELWLPAADR